jgi:NAD(P)-dependent dehydrogenase (short-subunit alcohol dehydrogenase family)
MPSSDLRGTTAIVTGASRGFGRATALAFLEAGVRVVAVARNASQLAELQAQNGEGLIVVAGDATDPILAGTLIDTYRPRTLVLNAGAAPLSRPIHQQTWQTFSRNWEVDVQHGFHWIREALLQPLEPGSTVIVMSSGAVLMGSPLSGGYAGSKATLRFMAAYAGEESDRAELGIRFVSVLPKLTPATDIGAPAVAAYARRNGLDEATYLTQMGPRIEPEDVGKHMLDLASSTDHPAGAYLLVKSGLTLLQ